jgi:hypothetical protein
MANKAISALDAASALTGSELIPVVQGGVTVRSTTQAIADLFAETQDLTQSIPIPCSDELTPFASGSAVVTFRMSYAFTLTAVRASLTTAQASGNILTIDIKQNGVSVLSTLITITNTEKTSTTAVTQPVISDAALADDAEITIDITQIGNSTATGLKVYLIGTKA